jgi:hypothetical protein
VLVARFAGITRPRDLPESLAREMRGYDRFYPYLDRPGTVNHRFSRKDQRKWARLKLAIPVFVRASSRDGKDSLEFATAINISPGGALVIARRSLTKSAWVSLEIPSAPIAPVQGMPRSSRTMRAKAVWVKHLDDYHLLGLKFARPIGTDAIASPRMRLRKAPSAV